MVALKVDCPVVLMVGLRVERRAVEKGATTVESQVALMEVSMAERLAARKVVWRVVLKAD